MTAETSVQPQPPPLWFRLIIGRRPLLTVLRATILILGTLIAFKFILVPIRIEGSSMLPTFKDGSIHLVNRVAYKNRFPQRGDVVAINHTDNKILVLKRIVGLPGERISIRGGSIYINGEPYRDEFSNKPIMGRYADHLKADEYFVIGDNRSISAHWAADRSRIVGKMLF